MDKLLDLLKSVHYIQRDAYSLRQVYEKEFKQPLEKGVRFDNLQNDVTALKHKLVDTIALNKKLALILNSFQDPLLTMLQFVKAIFEESSHGSKELLQAIYNLAHQLDTTLAIISEMKSKLHDRVMSVSKYSTALENELTTSVMKLLLQSKATDFVMAVRNYALVDEAAICGSELYGFLLPLYKAVL